jgi:hypothetical protein
MGVEVKQEGIGRFYYNDTCYGTVQSGNENFWEARKYYCLQGCRDFGIDKDVYTAAF